MNFKPVQKELLETNKKIDVYKLIEPGIYPFRVSKATQQISKNGNEMIKLMLIIKLDDGSTSIVFDYLLEKMAYKLKHFCESVGLLEKYDLGELHEFDCIGCQGLVEITIAKAEEKPDGTFYPEKNEVKDYKVNMPSNKILNSDKITKDQKSNDLIDDDIPF